MDPSRIESLVGQMSNDYRVLPAGEQDDRTIELFRHLAEYVDGFRLQLFKMCQFTIVHIFRLIR